MSRRVARSISPSPADVARRAVDEALSRAGDWHSDFVFREFVENSEEGEDATFEQIKAALRVKLDPDERKALDDPDDKEHEDAVSHLETAAAFHLGYALGARLGGVR